MNSSHQQWPASRIVHLLGGIRAINIDGPQVSIEPKTLHGKVTQFNTRSYGAIYSDIQQLGFAVVGVDFFTHISEVNGETPPNWRVYNQYPSTPWTSEETAQLWKGIAHSAFKQKHGHIWDLASRIGHQIRVCSWRIRQLSEAYHQQLVAKALKNEVEPGQRYEDGFTWNTYLAVQSYLVDACILRDYLSEFAAIFIFGTRYGIDASHVSTIGGLIKNILKDKKINDSLSKIFRESTKEGGWLKTLGEYRNLVVHSSPLSHAEKRLYAITDIVQIDSEGAIPLIKIPLPNNPGAISAKRASRKHFIDFEAQFDKYIESVSVGHSTIDAMKYIIETHGKLTELAMVLSRQSPVPYQDVVLTEHDIIGPIKILRE